MNAATSNPPSLRGPEAVKEYRQRQLEFRVRPGIDDPGVPVEGRAAFRGLMGVTGMERSEASGWLKKLGERYHREVRRLYRAIGAGVHYGCGGRDVCVATRNQKGALVDETVVKGGGVWIESVSGRRGRLVFETYRGTPYRIVVSLIADPDEIPLVPEVPVRTLPDGCDEALQAFVRARGIDPDRGPREVASLARVLADRHGIRIPRRQGIGYGPGGAERWCRDRGRMVYSNGAYLMRADEFTVSVVIAEARGREHMFRVPIIADPAMLEAGVVTMRAAFGQFYELLDEGGNVVLHAGRCPDGRWDTGRNVFEVSHQIAQARGREHRAA